MKASCSIAAASLFFMLGSAQAAAPAHDKWPSKPIRLIVRQGAVPGFGPPEHFDKMQRAEYAELGALIREIGMKVQ